MIELKQVDLSFERQRIFEKFDLSLQKGDRLVVLGPSGVGKSLLLKIIAGLVLPTKGEVLINQKNIHSLEKVELAAVRKKMGMLFQKNALFDSLSVGQNISFPLKEVGIDSEDAIEKKVIDLLDSVGILHAKNLFPDEISGGMQKRLGVARAISLEPEIILYDDPTAGLDPITSRKIADLILQLQNHLNSLLVLVTNDVNRAFQIANRILLLTKERPYFFKSVADAKACQEEEVYNFLRGISPGKSKSSEPKV